MRLLVTGAAGGIGGAIADASHARGFDVVAHDLRPPTEPDREGWRRAVDWIAGDLTDEEQLRRLCSHVGGGLDAVIAAHGIDASGSLSTLTSDYIRTAISVNTTSVFQLFRALRPQLEETKGRFVAIASQAGIKPEPNNALYCYSKALLVGWVRAYAANVSNDSSANVRLRVLCPGCTATPLLYGAQERFARAEGIPTEDFIRARAAAIPIGRFASVQETAAAACYLAEDEPRPTILVQSGGEALV